MAINPVVMAAMYGSPVRHPMDDVVVVRRRCGRRTRLPTVLLPVRGATDGPAGAAVCGVDCANAAEAANKAPAIT